MLYSLFFFNDTATTEIYTLSLHDALPIWQLRAQGGVEVSGEQQLEEPQAADPSALAPPVRGDQRTGGASALGSRSEEHTSELQSRLHLVCRLLLEKKKHKKKHKNDTKNTR